MFEYNLAWVGGELLGKVKRSRSGKGVVGIGGQEWPRRLLECQVRVVSIRTQMMLVLDPLTRTLPARINVWALEAWPSYQGYLPKYLGT